MDIKFKHIEDHLKDITNNLTDSIEKLEKAFIEGRNNNIPPIPIYMIRWRIKNADSIYRKIKCKKKSLKDILDYGGMRIVCLFEQEILETSKFVIQTLKEKGFKLPKIKVFMWDSEFKSKIMSDAKKYFDKCELEEPPRGKNEARYKSIHYIAYDNVFAVPVPIEIQLRTLFQDVWGELEHNLSYKQGSIHPHIKKSFELLSSELDAKDSLMKHLKEISDKERCIELFSLRKDGPGYYLDYEPDSIPAVFTKNIKLKSLHEEYTAMVCNKSLKIDGDCQEKGRKLYSTIYDELLAMCLLPRKLPKEPLEEVISVYYWAEMENAYLLFCEGKHTEAIEIYEELERMHIFDNKYVIRFRLGELHHIDGKIEKALRYYDECEHLLTTSNSTDNSVLKNRFKIKIKLAYIYWHLGHDFIDIAVEQIEAANEIYTDNLSVFPKAEEKPGLLNNLCWYSLERYIISNNKTDNNEKDEKKIFESKNNYKIAEKYFIELEEYLSSGKATINNMYDTAAWFCYHSYLKTNSTNWLTKAKDYCDKIDDKYFRIEGESASIKNKTTFKLMSINMHRNHIAEILNIAKILNTK
jgi:ppGpp synthetase/RelA/SpoT-type nucleotidyltranferase